MGQNQQEWEPEKTWVFSVGILEWEHEEAWASFPDAVEGRFDEKLINFFHSKDNRIRPYKPDMFAIGEAVEVEYEGEWYFATVQKAWYGLHFVSYEDFSEEWDEWVGSDRIR